jgi:hypothetical protein
MPSHILRRGPTRAGAMVAASETNLNEVIAVTFEAAASAGHFTVIHER